MDYYKKYQKYKSKYIHLLNEINLNEMKLNEMNLNEMNLNEINLNQIGGHRVALKYDTFMIKNIYFQLVNDLSEINQNLTLQYSKDHLMKREAESHNIIKRDMKRMIGQNEKIDKKKIFTLTNVKYNINDVQLSEKYLEKYNNVMKYMILSVDLYECGFYEYVFKLKQYLTKCGINRTTQLYGTCWFNTTINGIIFGSNMRGKLIQLLLQYLLLTTILVIY